MKGPFCIVSDDDGHHYVIQSKRQDDWRKFLDRGLRKDGFGELPRWAQQIDGPHSIDFIDYTVRA